VTAIAAPPISSPAPDLTGRVLLRGISWSAYRRLREELGDSAVHLTYDDGLLEIEVPSKRHAQLTRLAGAIVEALLDAAGVAYQPLANTTWDREDLLKAIEADECYYIQSVGRIQNKEVVDLAVDPPPDLAVEVEVTNPAIDKLRVYAALGVPEVWRVKEDASLHILALNSDSTYRTVPASAVVPRAAIAFTERYLRLLQPIGPLIHSVVIQQLRAELAKAPSK
jgi:Uma2 family endonuclease